MGLIIFSHGKLSGPNGTKIQLLRASAENYGFETISVDYTKCKHANDRLQLLRNILDEKKSQSTLLVGSSMGGYVSTVLSAEYELMGLFLLCPALYMQHPEYEVQNYHPKCDHIEIIHGWDDEVVPHENSINFGRETKAVLNLVNDNHRLVNSHVFIRDRFELFLRKINQR